MSSAAKQAEHLLQDDSSGRIEKRGLEAVDTDYVPSHIISHEDREEKPLRRFWARALVATFVPAIVVAYFGVIWLWLVRGIEHDETAKSRKFSGSLIFYAWFFIGVFVLSWSNYGLAGVEAGMLLRSRIWAADKSYSHNAWSSPSGWIRVIRYAQFSRLWSLLAVVTILPYVGIPLSGLVFELTDGFIHISDTPSVRGRNITTFNERYDSGALSNPVLSAWQAGAPPTIPGFGIIYTNGSVDRSEHPDFGKLPNTLPLSESIPDLFLVPQADKPVSGKAWGLRIKYDCSVVEKASQFTILSQKADSAIQHRACALGEGRHCFSLKAPTNGTILNLWNSTNPGNRFNVESYYEVGIYNKFPGGRYNNNSLKNFPDYEAEEGDTSVVFEYAAWQWRIKHGEYDDTKLPFNNTVEPSIEGMGSPFIKLDNGKYTVNTTFFTLNGDINNGVQNPGSSTNASELLAEYMLPEEDKEALEARVIDVAPPIGVRCVTSSGLGTAELDSVTSSFSDFQRVDPEVDPDFDYGPSRFGHEMPRVMLQQAEFTQHYIAGGLPGIQPHGNTNRFAEFVDGISLLRSVNLAHALEAFDLMYGVKSAFNGEWEEPGMSYSREGKILVVGTLIKGPVPGYVALAILSVWALASTVLGAMYGFRKRPVDTLVDL